MIIGQNGDIYSADEEEVECPKGDEWCPNTNPEFSSGDEMESEARMLVVLRSLNARPNHDGQNDEQRSNLFHMKCKVLSKTCLVIVDGGSCANMVSDKLVLRLGLKEFKHSKPYRLQWLGEDDEVSVKRQARVPLNVDGLEEEVVCDIIPMTVCHVLLGRPWEFDNKVKRDGYTNEYTFLSQGRKVCLKPLTPTLVYEAYEHLKKEREKDERLERKNGKSRVSGDGTSCVRHLSQSERKRGLLTTKTNHGWALKSHMPILLVIPQSFGLTNTNDVLSLSVFVDKVRTRKDLEVELQDIYDPGAFLPEETQDQVTPFLIQGVGSGDGGYHDTVTPSNFLPVVSSYEQWQVDPLLAKGSSILALTCNDAFMEHLGDQAIGIFDSTKPSFVLYDDPFLWPPSASKCIMPLLNAYLNLNGNKDMRVGNLKTRSMLCFYCKTITSFCGIGVFYGQLVKVFSSQVSIVEVVENDCLICHDISLYKLVRNTFTPYFYVSIINVPWNDHDWHICEVMERFVARVALLVNFICTRTLISFPRFSGRVAKCTYFVGMSERDLRTNPSQEREDDANRDTHHASKAVRPLTRAWARRMEEGLASLVRDVLEDEWKKVEGGSPRRRRFGHKSGAQNNATRSSCAYSNISLDRVISTRSYWTRPTRPSRHGSIISLDRVILPGSYWARIRRCHSTEWTLCKKYTRPSRPPKMRLESTHSTESSRRDPLTRSSPTCRDTTGFDSVETTRPSHSHSNHPLGRVMHTWLNLDSICSLPLGRVELLLDRV